MSSRTVAKCEALMQRLVDAGFTHQVSVSVLRTVIKRDIGGDPRTVRNWIQNLEDLGMLRRVGPVVWTLELNRVEGLLELAVVKGQQQKLV